MLMGVSNQSCAGVAHTRKRTYARAQVLLLKVNTKCPCATPSALLMQGQDVIAQLRDNWLDTPVNSGDAVNIVGVQPQPLPQPSQPHVLACDLPGAGGVDSAGQGCRPGPLHVTLDAEQGFLIVNPDVLLSGERVGGRVTLLRRRGCLLCSALHGDFVLGQPK